MDELTEKDREDVRAFIENTDGSYPDLSDLPAFWGAVGPDAPATVRTGGIFPGVTQREIMLLRYLVYARVKRWAWDGLDRLHKVLMERGEPIPEPLQNHVNEAHHGLLKQPSNPNRNPRYAPQDDRDFRIMHVVRALCGQGRTREQAIAEVADAMGKKGDTVESAVKKMEGFWPAAVKRVTIHAV